MTAAQTRVQIHGTAAPGFERVVDAFAATAPTPESAGGALCVIRDGEIVADLWAGSADHATGRAWHAQTPTVVFSCTKAVLAILVGQLVDAGDLDLDAPVARYWPEFAAAGKSAITVREAMAHRAGLAALRDDIDLQTALDWAAITQRIAAAEPLWQPGTGHAYHALTYGWIVGEVLRRITGRQPGDLLRVALTEPLEADMWIGIPASLEPAVARLHAGATLTAPPARGKSEADAATAQQQDLMGRSMTLGGAFPPDLVVRDAGFDATEVHQGQVPGAGGIASARGLAAVWSSAVVPTAGTAPLSAAVRTDMTRVQSEGQQVWPVPAPHSRWGTGFMIPTPAQPLLTDQSFGHTGAGGQLSFADPTHRIGFAYVTNVFEGVGDRRSASIVDALRDVLVTAR